MDTTDYTNKAPYLQEETERTFNDVTAELSNEDAELIFNEISGTYRMVVDSQTRMKYFKSIVKNYIDILENPLKKTSDELLQMNNYLTQIKTML